MNKLISLIIFSSLSVSLFCCNKNTELKNEEPAWFLFSSDMLFSGTISDSSLFWKFGVYQFQRGHSIIPVGANDSLRNYLQFNLTSNADLTTKFEINTPTYTAGTDSLFTNILSPGIKKFGKESEFFEMKLRLNGQLYTTNGDQTDSRLEVIKYEKTKSEINKDMVLAWFKTKCNFYRMNDKTFAFRLTDGLIIAGFLY